MEIIPNNFLHASTFKSIIGPTTVTPASVEDYQPCTPMIFSSLLTRISILLSLFHTVSTADLMDSLSVTSSDSALMFGYSVRIHLVRLSPIFWLRIVRSFTESIFLAVAYTINPLRANSWANARPNPVEHPVISTTSLLAPSMKKRNSNGSDLI